jgi:hypothetical protein
MVETDDDPIASWQDRIGSLRKRGRISAAALSVAAEKTELAQLWMVGSCGKTISDRGGCTIGTSAGFLAISRAFLARSRVRYSISL